jgi:hypothetical protein
MVGGKREEFFKDPKSRSTIQSSNPTVGSILLKVIDPTWPENPTNRRKMDAKRYIYSQSVDAPERPIWLKITSSDTN